ncbi:UNVERIFIED_CONTAM: LINE-1 retrotransposable element O protein [Sesamum latifolium]|uniref:LINE-1 retrotransposable element O protein n=1 Tax=Sesamum latifolium TaxID=2727402 RepID=A0AAW2X5F1_9LAMI
MNVFLGIFKGPRVVKTSLPWDSKGEISCSISESSPFHPPFNPISPSMDSREGMYNIHIFHIHSLRPLPLSITYHPIQLIRGSGICERRTPWESRRDIIARLRALISRTPSPPSVTGNMNAIAQYMLIAIRTDLINWTRAANDNESPPHPRIRPFIFIKIDRQSARRAEKPSKPQREPRTQPEPRPTDVESGIPTSGRANSGSIDLGNQGLSVVTRIRILYNTFDALMSQDDDAECERRALWQSLTQLADSIDEDPWLVMGDFNIIVDLSEVSGASGDIRVSMEEFQECITATGLITLPMQGQLFTWHNCSNDSHSLWKRLDRMMHLRILFLQLGMFGGISVVGTTMYAVTRKLKALKPVFRQQLKIEQSMLQQRAKMQWMKGGDQCTRVFFRKVATRRAAMRVFQINDENGHTHTTSEDITVEFDGFYRRPLGGDRQTRNLGLSHLRPWVTHTLTPEEVARLTRPVSREDIKLAFFDIAEDKSPGPDGYSASFYKAAWPVIGDKVTRAVMEFFINGRLLKQINATLLVFIPKVQAPAFVSDFRPISCCDVLYKAITKIIIQRIREVLDRLISPSRNAFVPGRKIGDNILLAQELFAGYNQRNLPKRCALKVDLRKTYDTVEWDFLFAAMRLFGIPEPFIRWVDECVTTPTFSICINSAAHGFFKGARGLRQGDPISPYLFVLVMKVLRLIIQQLIEQDNTFWFHWKCGEIGIFQLGFADDLLLFCEATNSSIAVFWRGLDVFATLSGLHVNPGKSHLILSKAAHVQRPRLLEMEPVLEKDHFFGCWRVNGVLFPEPINFNIPTPPPPPPPPSASQQLPPRVQQAWRI